MSVSQSVKKFPALYWARSFARAHHLPEPPERIPGSNIYFIFLQTTFSLTSHQPRRLLSDFSCQRSRPKFCMHISCLLCVSYVPSTSSSFAQPLQNFWLSVHIMRLLFTQFSLSICHFPQHSEMKGVGGAGRKVILRSGGAVSVYA